MDAPGSARRSVCPAERPVSDSTGQRGQFNLIAKDPVCSGFRGFGAIILIEV